VDLAIALRRYDRLGEWITACRRARPAARVGVHTQLPRELADAMPLVPAVVDDCSCVAPPALPDRATILGRLRRDGPVRLTVEVGAAPGAVHRLAGRNPQAWVAGADGLLLHAAADPGLHEALSTDLAPRWTAAFPGLEAPDLWA